MYRDRFKDYLQNERLYSSLTVRAYMDDLATFARFVEPPTLIEQCTVGDVRAYVMMLIERGDSTRSVNRRVSALRSFYNYLVRSAVIEINPTSSIRSLRVSKKLPHFVAQKQMEVIVESIQGDVKSDQYVVARDAAIILTLYQTGMRRAEIVALSIRDVDFERQSIKVTGKGSKQRVVPMRDELKEELKKYLNKREEFCCQTEQKSLFLNKKSERLSSDAVYRIVKKSLAGAGVEARRSPHTLRHTFATHLLAEGASILSIQELLGHESIASTQLYTHNTIESLRECHRVAHPRAKK